MPDILSTLQNTIVPESGDRLSSCIPNYPVYLKYYISDNIGDGINPRLFYHFFNHRLKIANDSNNKPCILGVGSIIEYFQNSSNIICGSGFIRAESVAKQPGQIISVRGPLSRQKFLDAGIECPEKYGDFGLFFPYIIPKPLEVQRKFRIGFIPHFIDADLDIVKRASRNISWKIIDIMQTGTPEKFVDEIHECDVILSSSLHGIIIADSYNIPAHHTVLSDKVIGGEFKFRDYYLSVGREYYNISIDSLNTEEILSRCKPYTIQFDVESYYSYVKNALERV